MIDSRARTVGFLAVIAPGPWQAVAAHLSWGGTVARYRGWQVRDRAHPRVLTVVGVAGVVAGPADGGLQIEDLREEWRGDVAVRTIDERRNDAREGQLCFGAEHLALLSPVRTVEESVGQDEEFKRCYALNGHIDLA